jgi:hypothetical protein
MMLGQLSDQPARWKCSGMLSRAPSTPRTSAFAGLPCRRRDSNPRHADYDSSRLWLSHREFRACWTRGWTQPAVGVHVVSRKRAGRCVRGDHTAHCEAARASEHLASVAVDFRRAVRGTGVTRASARRREAARRRRPPPAQLYGLDRSAQPGAAAPAGCGSQAGGSGTGRTPAARPFRV